MIMLWSALVVRAGFLQLFPSERLKALQERQFHTVITLQSRRGAIIDRKGRELAMSTTAYSLYADPKLLQGKKQLSRKLAKVLGANPESIYSKIKDKEKRFTWISRLIPKETAAEIKAWEIRGLSFVEEYKRVYPNETLAAHTLGMIGNDGQGLEGLELEYDQVLRGSKKKVSLRRDARGRPLIADGMLFTENPDGAEVKLTLDSEFQHMLEGELSTAVHEFDADRAFGVILDAKTSAILAMVNTPFFDANNATHVPNEIRRNRVVTDTFEPGSTLKTFAIATALKEKLVAPNTKYNVDHGILRIGKRIIHEAEASEKWSHLTVSEILAYSSNVGSAKIAFDLGPEKLRQGLIDFGFGVKIGVDLPGEAKGQMQPLPWNQHLLANIAFGQGVAVTPLQLANAYATIANGGTLNSPFIVQSIRDTESGETTETKVKPIRRVLSESEAASMRMMLMGVTADGGTGTAANVDGFLVAGKTGTAQKAKTDGRGYLPGAYVSSFAGFIPATDPKFVIYIAVDHPKKTSYYGASVAAPVFSRVASYAVRMEGLAPIILSEKNLVPGPSFKVGGASLDELKKKHKNKNAKNLIANKVTTLAGVTSQRMVASQINGASIKGQSEHLTSIKENAGPMIATDILSQSPAALPTEMPNLKGLSLREVLQKFTGQDVKVKFVGSGVVGETFPTAGSFIGEKQKITVFMK
jgi:cell division protein FtsI (penicillin-binding protein 3)